MGVLRGFSKTFHNPPTQKLSVEKFKGFMAEFYSKKHFFGISDNKSTNFLNSKYDTTRTDDKSFRSNQSSTLFRVKMETAKNDETIESL